MIILIHVDAEKYFEGAGSHHHRGKATGGDTEFDSNIVAAIEKFVQIEAVII